MFCLDEVSDHRHGTFRCIGVAGNREPFELNEVRTQRRNDIAVSPLVRILGHLRAALPMELLNLRKSLLTAVISARANFSEVVTVTNQRRTIYVAGVGSEDENATKTAKILYPGDLYGQCKYAWDKIKRTLEKQGAGLGDVVKATTYRTETRGINEHFKCRSEVFAGLSQPAGTLVGVASLAHPGMMIEVDVIAEVGK
jgi:2-iminobutanoate/2-iminopropanoate deaminase